MSIIQSACKQLAELSLHAPIGRFAMCEAFLRIASHNGLTPSVYGPVLQSRWHDATFRFCAVGFYGRYFSNFLKSIHERFSFIDIGANIGLYSLLAAGNPNCVRCYAFEPNPEVYASLNRNAKANGVEHKIYTSNVAISAQNDELRFAASPSHTGGGTIVQTGGFGVRCVNSAAFDQISGLDPTPKVVKIDVEGHEPVVVSELVKSCIWPQVRHLYFEADEDKYDVAAMISLLQNSGLTHVGRNGAGRHYDLMFARNEAQPI